MPQNPSKQPLIIAQVSDSHLFAQSGQLHCGVDVLANLKAVLNSLAKDDSIDYVVFTGDLTQDHTEASYQQFANAFTQANIQAPSYFLAGNHDEHALLNKHLVGSPFNQEKTITHRNWQVQLVNSKGETPSGYFAREEAIRLAGAINETCHQLVMMHHHPVDVGYFIDRHGLENKKAFWQVMAQHQNIRAISCGHVHRAHYFGVNEASKPSYQSVDVYTCPATSIQFDPNVDGVSALALGPAYRVFSLFDNGQITSEVVRLSC